MPPNLTNTARIYGRNWIKMNLSGHKPAPKSALSPDGSRVQFASGEDFSQWLISEHLISTVPWDDAGAFVRLSVTFEAGSRGGEAAVVDEIKRRMSAFKYEF